MGVEQVLAGVAAGLKSGANSYRDQRDHNDRQAQVTEANRIRNDEVRRKGDKDASDERERQRQIQAQQEIIDSLPDANPDGSPNTLKTALRVQYGFKGTTGSTIIRDAGQTQRHETPSGDTTLREEGANNRFEKQTSYLYDKLFTEEGGRNSRWATPSGNATLGSETARRGQDIGATTARRGQDVTASTAKRGQDVTLHGQELDFHLGTKRNETTRRIGDERNQILKNKKDVFDIDFSQTGGAAPAAAPTTAPAPAPVTKPGGGGAIPVTPRAAAPLPVPQTVPEKDLDALATTILQQQGVPPTPENLKTFKDRNRDRLIAQAKKAQGGGQ